MGPPALAAGTAAGPRAPASARRRRAAATRATRTRRGAAPAPARAGSGPTGTCRATRMPASGRRASLGPDELAARPVCRARLKVRRTHVLVGSGRSHAARLGCISGTGLDAGKPGLAESMVLSTGGTVLKLHIHAQLFCSPTRVLQERSSRFSTPTVKARSLSAASLSKSVVFYRSRSWIAEKSQLKG